MDSRVESTSLCELKRKYLHINLVFVDPRTQFRIISTQAPKLPESSSSQYLCRVKYPCLSRDMA